MGATCLTFCQMTIADYSLSDVAFKRVEHWKDTLKYVVSSCNQTEALATMIPQLEEFIDVAKSESSLCSSSMPFMCTVEISHRHL